MEGAASWPPAFSAAAVSTPPCPRCLIGVSIFRGFDRFDKRPAVLHFPETEAAEMGSAATDFNQALFGISASLLSFEVYWFQRNSFIISPRRSVIKKEASELPIYAKSFSWAPLNILILLPMVLPSHLCINCLSLSKLREESSCRWSGKVLSPNPGRTERR